MSWTAKRLGDVVTLQRGHDLPESVREDGNVPIVSSSGITGYHSIAKASAPGVVTGRYGTLGKVFYIEEDYWPLNTSLYATDLKGNEPRFVAYFLENALRSYSSDKAAVPGVDRKVLHELRVSAPDRRTQERISFLLAAYDDLIENNQRRMALLEEAARQLYREWFVRLRFPGHEHTPIINSVPEGWTNQTFGGVAADVRDRVTPEAVDATTPYIGLEHMPRRSISLSSWGRADEVTSTKFRFREGEIIFGKIRPYFHKVGIALVDGVASSDSIVIRPRNAGLRSFVLMIASSDPFVAAAAQGMREGSKMPRADWSLMQKYPVAVPPSPILRPFMDFVDDVVAQLKTLTFQNQKLRAARDLLLPRLMSGEIAV